MSNQDQADKKLGDLPTEKHSTGRRLWHRIIRWAVRLTSLAIAVVIVLPAIPKPDATPSLASFSPFVAIASAITLRTLSAAMLLAVPIIVLSLIGRRLFCRYFCPMGVVLDCAGLLGTECSGGHGRSILKRVPRFGHILVWTTLILSLFGVPLLLWLDPLSIFTAMLGIGPYPWLAAPAVCIIVLSILLPNVWCMKLCPLGATQDLIRLPVTTLRSQKKSNGPTVVLPASDDRDAKEPGDVLTGSARRRFLGQLIGIAALGTGVLWLARRTNSSQPAGEAVFTLRPPGAIDEPRFSALCTRCGGCMNVCPTQLLKPVGSQNPEVLNLGTPQADFDPAYCRDDCRACTQVCPSGAIRPLSLEAKRHFSIGVARVELDYCLLTYNHECQICKRECPRDAVTFCWDDESYTMTPEIDTDRCNGCGECVVMCPGTNDWEREADPATPLKKALRIVPVTHQEQPKATEPLP